MRLNTPIIFLVAQLTGVFPAVANADAAEECGDLGVMPTDNLPQGVDPNNIRTCADKPPGNDSDLLEQHGDLSKRACTSGEYDYGCSGGYCWRTCDLPGSGPLPVGQPHKWCWTAENEGYGPWIQCSSSRYCTGALACGKTDGAPCNACGCGC